MLRSLSWSSDYTRVQEALFWWSTRNTPIALPHDLKTIASFPETNWLDTQLWSNCPALIWKLWRRQWHPTPILLPGKFHGWRSLVGYSPWGRKELDMTEWLHLYESLKGWDDSIPQIWGNPQKKAEATLKEALTQAPALRLPDPEKALQLYVHEKEGIALGVLTQRLGPEPQSIAYLPKRIDPTAWGWPPCLQNLAAIAVLI